MEHDYIGFLLNALDEPDHATMEAHLAANPDSQARLDQLRAVLAPMAPIRDDISPPSTLRFDTLALVASHRVQQFHPVAVAKPASAVIPTPVLRPSLTHRSWWRRADVLAAAAILVVLLPLGLFGISHLRQQSNLMACKNNLHQFGMALQAYGDKHGGVLPFVDEKSSAGVYMARLRDAGLGGTLNVNCPSLGSPTLLHHALDASKGDAAKVPSAYAYSLGFRDNNNLHHGLSVDLPNKDMLPIMADRPPFEQRIGPCMDNANSRNHGGLGQNVLYIGGNVSFARDRMAGVNGDDIYVNRKNSIEAGVDKNDTVLGAPAFRTTLP